MMASLNGHDDIIQLLVNRKCNVNMAAYNKRTALHLAAERGNLQCCKVLLAFICLPLTADINGVMPSLF
jgi:ankyrin repeat protein